MSTYGDIPHDESYVERHANEPRNDHIESFQEWIDDGLIERNGKLLWAPPMRSMVTGHRVSVSDSYRPIETRKLNWRWWLAEIPMRMLARHMGRVESDRELRGEEYIGE